MGVTYLRGERHHSGSMLPAEVHILLQVSTLSVSIEWKIVVLSIESCLI